MTRFVFIQAVSIIGTLWSAAFWCFRRSSPFTSIRLIKTILAIVLTIAAMLIILFLLVLLLSLLQQVYVFGYSVITELIYRLKV